jgi:hypothetical protein
MIQMLFNFIKCCPNSLFLKFGFYSIISALQKAGKQMEDSMVASYVALLGLSSQG